MTRRTLQGYFIPWGETYPTQESMNSWMLLKWALFHESLGVVPGPSTPMVSLAPWIRKYMQYAPNMVLYVETSSRRYFSIFVGVQELPHNISSCLVVRLSAFLDLEALSV